MKDKFSKQTYKDFRRDPMKLAKEKDNPAEFYAINAQLLRDAASFSFNKAVGSQYTLWDKGFINLGTDYNFTDNSTQCQPGIWALTLLHSPGMTLDGVVAPLNVSKQLFNRIVRHANSGSRNYDSSDLMIYALAMAEPYAFYAFMCRTYGLLNAYDQKNRYLPRQLLMASGVNFDDLSSHIADFRKYINQYAAKLNSLAAPKEWTLYSRRAWIYSHVFKDSERSKSQFFLYKPAGFYKFSPISSQTGGELVFQPMVNSITYDGFRQLGDTLINALLEDEDCNTMSGDIEKAYTDAGLWKVQMISEDFTLTPVYSATDLAQVQNAWAVGYPMTWNSTDSEWVDNYAALTISQKNNQLVYNPKFRATMASQGLKRIFVLHTESPEPADIIDAAALTVAGTFERIAGPTTGQGGIGYFIPSSCGTEMVMCHTIYTFDYSTADTTGVQFRSYTIENNILAMDEYAAVDLMQKQWESFDWHPILYIVHQPAVLKEQFIGILSDMDNYRVMSHSDLDGLHECALLSEFNVPTIR